MEPPYFSFPPESLYEVLPGSDLNLTCVASGSPVPRVTWKKGNIELDKENIPIGENVLTLTDVQESSNYTCVASSKHDTVEKVSQVIVLPLHKIPNNLKAFEIWPTSFRLSWEYAGDLDTHFTIYYKPKNANQFQMIRGVTGDLYVFNGLNPNTEYEIFITVHNKFGEDQSSTPFFVSTGDDYKNLVD